MVFCFVPAPTDRGTMMVRAEGVEPSRARKGSTDFRTVYGFRRPGAALGAPAPGLRSGLSFTISRIVLGLRCCPSSLYTFRRSVPSGLGSGSPFQGSPNLGSSASPVSRRALKFSLSPLRLPVPPHPHGHASTLSIIGQPGGICRRFSTAARRCRKGFYRHVSSFSAVKLDTSAAKAHIRVMEKRTTSPLVRDRS